MPIRPGVQSALDRLFQNVAGRQAVETPEPEQLETLPSGLPQMPQAQPVSPPVGTLPITPPTPPESGRTFAEKAFELLQLPLVGAEQFFTMAGAILTSPARPQAETGKTGFVYTPPQEFLPGGAEYRAFQQWRDEKQDPAIPLPIPSWKQLGAWLKPILKKDATLKALGVDVESWEEPEQFEFARMGMAMTAEALPLMMIGGPTTKPVLEKAADVTIRQIAKGKTPEEALNTAFNLLAGKGKLKPPAIPPPSKAPLYRESAPAISDDAIRVLEAKDQRIVELRDKIVAGLKTAKTKRAELEAGKKEKRLPKFQQFEERLRAAKTPKEVEEAYSSLYGKLLPEDADITPLINLLSDNDWAFFINYIREAQAFTGKPLTAGNTIKALSRLVYEGKVPRVSELRNLDKVFGEAFGSEVIKSIKFGTKLRDLITGIINIPKAMLASVDLSATLRQAVVLTTAYPIKSAKATWAGARAGISELFGRQYAEKLDDAIRSSPHAWKRAKLAQTELPARGRVLTHAEEAFMSNIVHRIPIISKITKMSEKAFVTTLNKLRADIFDSYAALWEGKAGQREWDNLSELLNILSGRGHIESRTLQGFTVSMNNVLFSPRLQISRLQSLALPITLWKYSPVVRRVALRNIASFIGVIGGIVMAVKMANIPGVTVETDDPTSADYGKIKVGETRQDPWGGFQQYVKLAFRLATGKLKTSSGKVVDIDRFDELVRFTRMKFSPAMSLVADILQGQTVIGEEMTVEAESIKQQLRQRFVPLFIQDFLDALQLDGSTGAITASPGFFGVGVVSYPSKTYMDWLEAVQRITGKEWTQDTINAVRPDFNKAEASWYDFFQLPTEKSRRFYREDNPEIEASMYFWGEVKSLTTPEAIAEFKKLAEQYNIPEEAFPIKEEEEPFEAKGKSPDEIFFALIDNVPSFYAEYLRNNKEAIPAEAIPQVIGIFEKERMQGRQLVNKYRLDTKGLEQKEREAYRQSHPEIDVALNLWSTNTSLLSRTAYALLRDKITSLGIPEDVVPVLIKKEKVKVPVREVPKRPTLKRVSKAQVGQFLSQRVKELFGR